MTIPYLQPRTPDEVRQAFAKQIRHLRRSMRAFDSGEFEESERIASAIFNLVHDSSGRGKNSQSLLSQVGIRSKIDYITTSGVNLKGDVGKNEWRPPLSLCTPVDSPWGVTYKPLYHNHIHDEPKFLKFNKWWNELIFENVNGQKLSRFNLLHSLRSADGGSHVDPFFRDQAYHYLSTSRGGWYFREDQEGALHFHIPISLGKKSSLELDESIFTKVPNGHWASARQIAWELEASLIREGLIDNFETDSDAPSLHILNSKGIVPKPMVSLPLLVGPQGQMGPLTMNEGLNVPSEMIADFQHDQVDEKGRPMRWVVEENENQIIVEYKGVDGPIFEKPAVDLYKPKK